MKREKEDVLCRAAKTFWQAMLAYLLADVTVLQEVLSDWQTGRRMLLTFFVGALAAGFSAVYNGVVKPLLGGKDHERQL